MTHPSQPDDPSERSAPERAHPDAPADAPSGGVLPDDAASDGAPSGDVASDDAASRDPMSRTGDWQPVDRSWVVVWRLREWLDSLMLVAVAAANGFVISRIAELPDRCWMIGCALLLAGLGVHSHLWPAYAFAFHGLRLLPEDIEIHSGALFRTVTAIPRERVQHVDVAQGPIERRYRIARLVIHTAGARSGVELAGVAESLARRIRDDLMRGRPVDPA